jgi:hypothetical protein
MDNIFTKNSRFDVLNEDDEWKHVTKKNKKEKKDNLISEEPKINSFKNDRPHRNNANNYRENNRYYTNDRNANDRKLLEEKNKEAEKLRKQKEEEESLKGTNFPELHPLSSIKKTVYEQPKTQVVSFINKLKEDTSKKEKECKEEVVEPGWVCITINPNNRRKFVYKYGKSLYESESKKEKSNPLDVLNALVELNEKRKNEYIQLWGEEEYEKMFRIPNYDYDYFDRLDEEYEEAMEQEKYDNVEEYESY